MESIAISTLAIGLIGLAIGLGLVVANKKFFVEEDDRVTKVRECLRGSNCGACGYAGCDAVAEAIVSGEAPVDACPGNSTENIARIAAVLGKESVSQKPQVASVRCAGTCGASQQKANYVGLKDCRSAVLCGLSFSGCDSGCLGLGSCVRACPQGAISVRDGVAVVDKRKCIGCGLCVRTCPKGLIVMQDRDEVTAVFCSNREKGAAVKKVCSAGCIGCGICVKVCPGEAVTLENNLAKVDPEKCAGCGICTEKCPTGAIRMI